jgi:protein O-GlcNAc transferase
MIRDRSNAQVERGQLLMKAGLYEPALAAFLRALQFEPHNISAAECKIRALQALDRYVDAIEAIAELKSRLVRAIPYLDGQHLYAKLSCADWSGSTILSDEITIRVRRGELADSPLSFMSHNGSAEDQCLCARIFSANRIAGSAPLFSGRSESGSRRIRIAYVSADFRSHPVAHLFGSIASLHNRRRFATYAFATGSDDGSEARKAVAAGVEHFIDVSTLSDLAVAKKIAELEIDIAVDLTGHTVGSCMQIFSHRPAPVQISFLGFPGTLGTDFMDYIIGDRHVIPEASQPYFNEKPIYMPDCYLPIPRVEASEIPSRSDVGLPSQGFVFCCYNYPNKIDPEMFDAWMRILRTVPNSVIWLRDVSRTVKQNLAHEAKARGVEPSRLIYAPRVTHVTRHIARLSLADLFLDTYPYNAHATAIDTLIAGVPILTIRGDAFASRVATSLLRGCGLGHLSVSTRHEYIQMAVSLANHPEKMTEIQLRLKQAKACAPMFDNGRFCRHLEDAYAQAWSIYAEGSGPAAIQIGPGP